MIGKELRRARLAAGLTQEKLALQARVDRSYLSELERDEKSPTIVLLFRLCDAMDTHPSTLLARIETQRRPKR